MNFRTVHRLFITCCLRARPALGTGTLTNEPGSAREAGLGRWTIQLSLLTHGDGFTEMGLYGAPRGQDAGWDGTLLGL